MNHPCPLPSRRWLLRASTTLLACYLTVAASPAMAWAQESSGSSKSQMAQALPYALVIFVIALGLMVVCRPTHRKDVEGAPVSGSIFAFAKSGTKAPAEPQHPTRKKPHRGPLLLVLSILSYIICPLISFVSYSMANADLEQMHTGFMDRSGEGLTKSAKIISLVAIILLLVSILGGCVIGFFVAVAAL